MPQYVCMTQEAPLFVSGNALGNGTRRALRTGSCAGTDQQPVVDAADAVHRPRDRLGASLHLV